MLERVAGLEACVAELRERLKRYEPQETIVTLQNSATSTLSLDEKVALFRSLFRGVIVDECHHVTAVSFERVLKDRRRLKGYATVGYTLKPQGLFADVKDETSLIYDGQSFLTHFLRSLAQVKRGIVIACPRIKPGRNSTIMTRLLDLATQGIKIAVVTREANEHTEHLQMHGAQIIFKEDLTLNCAILDHSIVWYGNVQVLGYHSPNDNIITLHNPELATTMLNILHQ